jgi:phage terminase small subunit
MPKKRPMRLVVRDAMVSLGVYKPEFEPMILIYCDLREQYDELTKRFKDSDYDFEEPTQTGTKKAPIVTTLESLRKDILSYASQLGLTPQGLLRADETAFAKKKRGGITDMLRKVESG